MIFRPLTRTVPRLLQLIIRPRTASSPRPAALWAFRSISEEGRGLGQSPRVLSPYPAEPARLARPPLPVWGAGSGRARAVLVISSIGHTLYCQAVVGGARLGEADREAAWLCGVGRRLATLVVTDRGNDQNSPE